MNDDKSKIKKVIIFNSSLIGVGGAERLLFEEAKFFQNKSIETYVLTFDFKKDVLFGDTYNSNIVQVGFRTGSKNLLSKIIKRVPSIFALRKKIKEIKPDIIISTNSADCIYLYFATLFTSFSYVTHIHGTIFWFPDELLKYAIIHKKVFLEIRDSVAGHREFISIKPSKLSLLKWIFKEVTAIAMYMGVRKAKNIFVLSNQMKWEVKKLYGKDSIVLKGAFPSKIFNYKPRQNIKDRFGLMHKKMILNINRLDQRKRIDLLIRAFIQVCNEIEDIVLVIGGVGPEGDKLKILASELNIEDRVKFVGYIEEEELWDFLASCDVFAHPNWADFAIAPFEALALQKKVVWSSEMEIDENLVMNRHIFVADPKVDDFAETLKKALMTEVPEEYDMSNYTWESYFEKVYAVIK